MELDFRKWKSFRQRNWKFFRDIESDCLYIAGRDLDENRDEIDNLKNKLKSLPEEVRPKLKNRIEVKLFAEQLANKLARKQL